MTHIHEMQETEAEMSEWVLILTINLMTFPGEMRDVSPIVVDGFQSKQKCDSAAAAITGCTLVLLGKAREQQGINSSESRGVPAI